MKILGGAHGRYQVLEEVPELRCRVRKDLDEQSVCVMVTDVGQIQTEASVEPMTWGGAQPQGVQG